MKSGEQFMKIAVPMIHVKQWFSIFFCSQTPKKCQMDAQTPLEIYCVVSEYK